MRDDYGRRAEWYDRLVEPLMTRPRQVGMALSPLGKNARVLDVCCGTGTFLQRFAEQGHDCFGIDLSRAMLAKARGRLKASAFLQEANAANLPFRPGTFHLVVISMALHEIHSRTRSAILQEADRVLSPKGHFLIVDYHPGPVTTPRGWLEKTLIHCIEFAAGRRHFTHYREFIKAGGIGSLAARHGLRRVRQQTVVSGNLGVYLLAGHQDPVPAPDAD